MFASGWFIGCHRENRDTAPYEYLDYILESTKVRPQKISIYQKYLRTL